MSRILTTAYVAVSVYFAVAYMVTGNEMALLVALWGGLMLEIRGRHEITITITSLKEKEDGESGKDDGAGQKAVR